MKLPYGNANDAANGWKLSFAVLEQIQSKIEEKEFNGNVPSLEEIEDVLLAFHDVSKSGK